MMTMMIRIRGELQPLKCCRLWGGSMIWRYLPVRAGLCSPVIFWAVFFMSLWRSLLSAAEQSAYHTVIHTVLSLWSCCTETWTDWFSCGGDDCPGEVVYDVPSVSTSSPLMFGGKRSSWFDDAFEVFLMFSYSLLSVHPLTSLKAVSAHQCCVICKFDDCVWGICGDAVICMKGIENIQWLFVCNII